jgi:hypothetical protein
MIRQCGATHFGQGDTRLGPGAHWCLRYNHSEVLIEVVSIDVLAALARPFQGYPGIPYLARQMSESRSPAGWRSAPALSPEMRRGLGVSLDRWSKGEEHKNTKGLEWFGPPERNTLLHCEMYCLRACMS